MPEFLPGAGARLTFPVDYWNGLGILVALAVPLLLRAATVARTAIGRGLALAPVPAVVAAIYLTSSRGAVAAALLGILVFVALTDGRWRAVLALALAAAGSAWAVAVLAERHSLVDGPLGSGAAIQQGRSAAVLVALACALTGVAHGLASLWKPRRRPHPALGWGAVALALALAVVGIALAHPVKRLNEFKQPPTSSTSPNFIQAHLLSGRGNGRWQFWRSAVDEFRDRPLLGHGAGSYESWWARHGSIAYFVRDAHSLYLETLGELGIVGFVFLVGALALGLASAVRTTLGLREVDRAAGAALTASFCAYALAAGLDWMWELTVVTVVGVTCLALAVSLAAPVAVRSQKRDPWLRRAGWASAAVVVLALIVLQAIPLVSELELRKSQAAASRGDTSAAPADAAKAHDAEPWAASPYLQYALVEEASGDFKQASVTIRRAIDRSSSDWRLWLVAARIETRAKEIALARGSIRRAIALNPRSPIFAGARR